jgi:hypothetical protein
MSKKAEQAFIKYAGSLLTLVSADHKEELTPSYRYHYT